MRTLIVEDDEDTRQLLEQILAARGHEVSACADGPSAWQSFQQQRQSLIILDLHVPGMDGLEVCRKIRSLPEGDRSLILVITGSQSEDLHAVLKAGADDYLPKPVTIGEIQIRLAVAERQIRNLNQRKRTEEALRKSEERFQILARATNDAIWDWDVLTNKVEWNEGVQTLLSYSSGEVGSDFFWWYENIHPEDRERVLREIRSLIDGDERLWISEYLYRCSNGYYVMVMDRGYVVRDDLGKAVRMISCMMDITERKQAEREIQKLAAFAQFNPNPVLEFAEDGTLTYFNEATQKLTKLLGKEHPLEILPANHTAVVKKCLATGSNKLRLETQVAGRTISWSYFPIQAINAAHTYAFDITERINLENQLRQSQKMESVGQLAAGVAHDFNNILTIIQGYARLVQGKNQEPKIAEPMVQIYAATERAANLTRQLLTFSRQQVMQPKVLDLNEAIGNITKMLRRVLGADIVLQFNDTPNLPPIYADEGMIDQVIMNLAVNARDAMPKGGQLTISTTSVMIDEAYLQRNSEARVGEFAALSVTDSGCGIPPDVLPRIFEPFFTTKEVGKGTGLGLATVYGIVKQHQGWIEVISRQGQGTTFKILFPATTRSVQVPVGKITPAKAFKGTETILVVEDEPTLRMLTRVVLEEYGYKVLEAGSGHEALKVWAENLGKIDLLQTDMVMPGGMTGRELATQLHASNAGLKVVYISGYSADRLGEDGTLREGLNFLQKPFQPESLVQVVRACLDN